MEANRVVMDTNELLHFPENMNEFDSVIIPITVIEELDNFKSESSERGYKARQAIKEIDKANHLEIDFFNTLHPELHQNGWIINNDNLIISSAMRYGCALVTSDLNMKLKAQSAGVSVIMNGFSMVKQNRYTGIKQLTISDDKNDQQLLAAIYGYKNENVLDMFTNQYVVIKDTTGATKDILRYNGTCLVPIQLPGGKRGKDTPVIPKNDYQRCAIDLLNNKDIPIKIICGTYGSGKTLLSIRMGLYHLKSTAFYGKIMVVRNPIGSGEEIGFLPGNKDEKINDFFKPISQNLQNGDLELQQMIVKEEISFEVPYFMKGMSILDTYLLVDEAEDMDSKTLKLIGTRVGEGSCVVFSGDYGQAEKQFQKDNGLMHFIDKKKGHPLVGIVVMDEDVRSDASKVFAELE